jgi:hypothetical protein
MLITEEPVCANGRLPVMIYYQARGCIGKIRYTSGAGSPLVCIWNTLQPRYWSTIWRCGFKPDLWDKQGAEAHQVAIPPPAPWPESPKSAVVIPYLTPMCTWQNVGGNEPIIVPIGNCLATPGYGIQILSIAVCENGTRAQWARFEDVHCGSGTISPKYGLADIADEDQGKGLSTGPVESKEKIRSVAFSCDELRTSKKGLSDREAAVHVLADESFRARQIHKSSSHS